MGSCNDASVLFTLTVAVCVVSTSTEWHEIVPSAHGGDADSSSRHSDVARSAGRPRHPPRPPPLPPHGEERRFLTDFDRQAVIETLNRLRRSLGASDMYYTSWDGELERHADELTSGCKLRRKGRLSLSAKYARGLTGYTRGSNIAGEIQKIYHQGANNTFYSQIMSSHLMYVGCAVGVEPCFNVPRQPPPPPLHVFTCLFSYSRNLTGMSKAQSVSSPLCSQCDSDALWCDAGLCRIACRPRDFGCARADWQGCEKTCSQCNTAVNGSLCQCLCYYDNEQRRCTDNAEHATRSQPICRAAKKDSSPPPHRISAGYLSLAVCVLLAFISICVIVVCCVTRCRSRKRHQQRASAAAARRLELADDLSTSQDFVGAAGGSSTFVVAAPSSAAMVSPPSYLEVERVDEEYSPPPSYVQCLALQQYDVTEPTAVVQLYSVADLPTPVQATAPPPSPPTTTTSSNDPTSSTSTDSRHQTEYRNPAYVH